MRRLAYIASLILFLWAPSAWAQVLPEDIDIVLFPTEPKPGERVSATAQSFGLDLTSATITWVYNGATIGVGTGKTSVVFTAPSSASVSTLSVTATNSQRTAQSTVLIRSASVDVVWEAIDAYTPPFYKGKALAPVGGRIRATAVPSVTAPKTLSYNWRYNGDAVPTQSGTNKNSLTIKTDVLGDLENLAVSVQSGGFAGSGSVQVKLRDPDVLIYKKLNGFIDYAFGSVKDIFINTPGVTLRAEPFNFSVANGVDKSVSLGFTLGDQSFVGTTNAQELSITSPEDTGESPLSVMATSLRERLQLAKRNFTLHF